MHMLYNIIKTRLNKYIKYPNYVQIKTTMNKIHDQLHGG